MKSSLSLIAFSLSMAVSVFAHAQSEAPADSQDREPQNMSQCLTTAGKALQGTGYQVGPEYGAYHHVYTILDSENIADGPVGDLSLNGESCAISLDSISSLDACSAKAMAVLKNVGAEIGPLFGAYEGRDLTIVKVGDQDAGPIGDVSVQNGRCEIELNSGNY